MKYTSKKRTGQSKSNIHKCFTQREGVDILCPFTQLSLLLVLFSTFGSRLFCNAYACESYDICMFVHRRMNVRALYSQLLKYPLIICIQIIVIMSIYNFRFPLGERVRKTRVLFNKRNNLNTYNFGIKKWKLYVI